MPRHSASTAWSCTRVRIQPGQSRKDCALIGDAIGSLLAERPRARTMILLEHTAGQGTNLGHRFEHLASILDRLNGSPRVGVCLDTCHLLTAGYDICSEEGYEATFRQLARIVGLDRVRVFHLNDSKKPCGSRVDRHEHIGKGCLGLEPFRRLLNDPRFADLPMLLETPKLESAASKRRDVDAVGREEPAHPPEANPDGIVSTCERPGSCCSR